MAKISKEELIAKFKTYVGERTDDATIELLEDISDSVSGDEISTENLIKDAVDEVEERWRRKYIERFNGAETKEKEVTIDKLFE